MTFAPGFFEHLADVGTSFFRSPPAFSKYCRIWFIADNIIRSDIVNRPINIAPRADRYLSKVRYPAQYVNLLIKRFAAAVIGKAKTLKPSHIVPKGKFPVHFWRYLREYLCIGAAPHIVRPNMLGIIIIAGQLLGVSISSGTDAFVGIIQR